MAEDAASSVSSDTAGPPKPAGNGNGNGHGAHAATRPANPAVPGSSPGLPTVAGSQPATTRAAAEALTDTPPVRPARMVGLDLGPACNQCGGMMQRTGSCYTCSSCGNNTGCG
jgi:ribonucleoside-diphosphate reductase alpha chain